MDKNLVTRISHNDADAMIEMAQAILSGNAESSFFSPLRLLQRAESLGSTEARNLLLVLYPEESSSEKIQKEKEKEVMNEEEELVEEDDTLDEKTNSTQSCDGTVSESDAPKDDDIDEGTEDIKIKPYEQYLIDGRIAYESGNKEQAMLYFEKAVDTANPADFANPFIQDVIVQLAVYYIDTDKAKYERFVKIGAQDCNIPVLQYSYGKELILNNEPELITEGISMLQKAVEADNELISNQSRIALLNCFLTRKGLFRKNASLIAQYFNILFSSDSKDSIMVNILLADYIVRMSTSDLKELLPKNFAETVGLKSNGNLRKLAIEAYHRAALLASKSHDSNERAIAVIALQKIAALKKG